MVVKKIFATRQKWKKKIIASFLLNLFGTFTFTFHQTLLVDYVLHLIMCVENSVLDDVQALLMLVEADTEK